MLTLPKMKSFIDTTLLEYTNVILKDETGAGFVG
jgi:hypothetical protein